MCLGSVGQTVVSMWAACRLWGNQELPSHVECYLYGNDGSLAFRSFGVTGADSANGGLRVTHRGSAGGLAHSGSVIQLALAPGASNFVASLDDAHVCHIWRLYDTELAHAAASFRYLISLPHEHKIQAIAWAVGGTLTCCEMGNMSSFADCSLRLDLQAE